MLVVICILIMRITKVYVPIQEQFMPYRRRITSFVTFLAIIVRRRFRWMEERERERDIEKGKREARIRKKDIWLVKGLKVDNDICIIAWWLAFLQFLHLYFIFLFHLFLHPSFSSVSSSSSIFCYLFHFNPWISCQKLCSPFPSSQNLSHKNFCPAFYRSFP